MSVLSLPAYLHLYIHTYIQCTYSTCIVWSLSFQLKCCGLNSFTDYENLFNNLSVPVSCCNTTHPLVNQSTCPEIVTNATLAHQISQIYTDVIFSIILTLLYLISFLLIYNYKGCVSHLESFYRYIFKVVGWYYISWGIVMVCHLNNHTCACKVQHL